MTHKRVEWGNKYRVTLCLTAEQWRKLETLYSEAQKISGPGASRSRIVGKMILDAGDKIERKQEQIKKLARMLDAARNDLEILEADKEIERKKIEEAVTK